MKNIFNKVALTILSAVTVTAAAQAGDVAATQDSQMLAQLEVAANAASPAKKIVILDYDLHLLHILRESQLLRYSLKNQFETKGVTPQMDNVSPFRDTMGGIESFHPAYMGEASMSFVDDKGVKICAVAPATPDVSSLASAQSYFNLRAGVSFNIAFAPRVQMMRGTYQALWHCFDDKYQPEVEKLFAGREADPQGFAYARHKAEMFAETAAGLEMAVKGDNNINTIQADLRALRAATAGPRFAKMFQKSIDYEYYEGAMFYLTPALDAVARHVSEVGADKVKTYTMEDIKRIAADITDKQALTRTQFRSLNEYHRSGSADAFVKTVVTRLHDAETRTGVKSSDFVPPAPSTGDYKTVYSDKFIEAASEESRNAVINDFTSRIEKGATPERAMVGMLDEFRAALHGADTSAKAEEVSVKITLLRALADNGNLRGIAGAKPVVIIPPAPAASAPSV